MVDGSGSGTSGAALAETPNRGSEPLKSGSRSVSIAIDENGSVISVRVAVSVIDWPFATIMSVEA